MTVIVEKTVPCRICGNDTPMTGTKLCNRCWELERRIQADLLIALEILMNELRRKLK